VIPRFPVYLFDIDGTLLDSAGDICGALQQVLVTAKPAREVTFEYLKSFIGFHLIEPFTELFPAYSREQIDGLIQEYRTIYLARGHRQTTPYPGVAETLAALGGRKSTATTKGTPTTRAVLEQFGLARYFDHVQGTDGIPCKPAPDSAPLPPTACSWEIRRPTWKPAAARASAPAPCATDMARPRSWRSGSRITGRPTCASCSARSRVTRGLCRAAMAR